ncbi:hypothetical protein [Piscibacillus halophilus]|uniref:Uncharacterized protein n=1 Tax=Piscibacillus halophilus TaxID=571933 RepID=A0A1H9JUT3_9BACI|nr:hypothetical protein [Piscibacillus halophilus]SEQ90599.1 hypothetical protein SAMN05216362_13319 [Piscibacillus halophilus]
MNWTLIFGCLSLLIYLLSPWMNLKTVQRAIGITLFLEVFYLLGHYIMDWPFPTPLVLMQLLVVSSLGVALGVCFSKIWPLPLNKGFERIFRTFLVVIPSLGLGMGLQILLQGAYATQAIYLIFALAAWIGSGQFVRTENGKQPVQKKVMNSVS